MLSSSFLKSKQESMEFSVFNYLLKSNKYLNLVYDDTVFHSLSIRINIDIPNANKVI